MVKKQIVLAHQISKKGLEVDKAKIEVIDKLSYPTNVQGVQNSLGHASFYRRFIKDFVQVSKSLSQLLQKEIPFEFNGECRQAFEILKQKLILAPIIVSLDWTKPFMIMCGVSDYVVGAILRQDKDKVFHAIHYASKKLYPAQCNYTTIEKEMLVVVFACEKFRPYLMANRVYVYSDHSALKYVMKKKEIKVRLMK